VRTGEILGFIVLAPPRSPLVLDSESHALLRMAGRQVASYLAEERATKALLDAKSLIDYSSKFAFIVHDVKNLSSQLGMMVTNAKRYSENREFRADMIRTLENAVGRLNGLLSKLRVDGAAEKQREIVEVGSLIRTVVGEFVHSDITVEANITDDEVRVKGDAQEFRSVLTHLVTNAIEASDAGKTVKVSVRRGNDRVIIDVEDEGCGMDPAFIRNELFTPRRSTKANGHGIGAFQAREIVRAIGGDLDVISVVGRGTVMRIMMPSAAALTGSTPQALVRA
jgi:putative PEP-CTERM system histidine kinase